MNSTLQLLGDLDLLLVLSDTPVAGDWLALPDKRRHALSLGNVRTLPVTIEAPAVKGTAQLVVLQQGCKGLARGKAVGYIVAHVRTVGSDGVALAIRAPVKQ